MKDGIKIFLVWISLFVFGTLSIVALGEWLDVVIRRWTNG
jgi:hypothetical protein